MENTPYIAAVEGWPDSEEKNDYIEALKRLRHLMILFKLGYGDMGMGYAFVNLKNKYPEAHEAFKEGLEDL